MNTLRTVFRASSRSYHSYSHPISNQILDKTSIKYRLLNNAIKYVPETGFSERSIINSVRELGYPDSMISSIDASNNYDFEMMLFWLKTTRDQLERQTANPKYIALNDEYSRLVWLINKRLEFNIPVVNQLQAGLSTLVNPFNVSSSMEELHNLSDDLAFYAGDKSNDFSWYSKRFSISSIYVSSELYMLNDTSREFKDTRDFVQDKVDTMKNLGAGYTNLEEWGAFNAISLLNLIKSQLARG